MADKFDYNNAHSVAVRLINLFGQAGHVVKKGNASGWEDGKPIPAEPDVIIDGLVSPKVSYKQSQVDGENILMGDAYAFFESVTPPEIGMLITLNGITFRIVDLEILDSVDDINIYRKMQLRK